jgi:hypothetical protein
VTQGRPQRGHKALLVCSDPAVSTAEPLPEDADALRALLLAERTRHAVELVAARALAKRAAEERDRAHGEIARLRLIIKALQRHRFGRRAEVLDPDQLSLALEDLEQTVAAAEAALQEPAGDGPRPERTRAPRRTNRGALSAQLPREEIVLEPEDCACPCCGGAMHVIGEDVAERLDVTPARFKVLVTRRPKYACRGCAEGVVQAPAPEPDRGRHPHRAAGGTRPRRQVRRPPALVPPGADVRPPGSAARPLDAGRLGRPRRLCPQARACQAAGGSQGLGQAVRG